MCCEITSTENGPSHREMTSSDRCANCPVLSHNTQLKVERRVPIMAI